MRIGRIVADAYRRPFRIFGEIGLRLVGDARLEIAKADGIA